MKKNFVNKKAFHNAFCAACTCAEHVGDNWRPVVLSRFCNMLHVYGTDGIMSIRASVESPGKNGTSSVVPVVESVIDEILEVAVSETVSVRLHRKPRIKVIQEASVAILTGVGPSDGPGIMKKDLKVDLPWGGMIPRSLPCVDWINTIDRLIVDDDMGESLSPSATSTRRFACITAVPVPGTAPKVDFDARRMKKACELLVLACGDVPVVIDLHDHCDPVRAAIQIRNNDEPICLRACGGAVTAVILLMPMK